MDIEKTTRRDHRGPKAVDQPRASGERCPHCREAIPADAPLDLCPSCLFGVGLLVRHRLNAGPLDPLDDELADTAPPSGERLPEPAAESGDRLIGGHRLVHRIDGGGQGDVFEARDLRMGRDVALKMFLGGERPSRVAVRRFQGEVKASAKLDHPNIVPIYEAGEHKGRLYFTMKLMRGGSLAGELEREGALDPKDAAALMEKVARAVHHLHQRGILHRDLKSANILLDEAGEPHVADFGVAKHLDESAWLTGAVVGTVLYMAPEQTDGHTTAHCDVYSLGVILYELITGRLPFMGETRAEIVAKIKHVPPEDPRAISPRLDRDLARICLRCLEKDPELRYGSADALALALRRYLNREPQEWATRLERAWRWYLRHAMTAGLIAAVVTFALIMMPSAVTIASERASARRAQIQQVNMNSAAMVAGTVLSQLRALSDAVERAAAEPTLARAIQDGDVPAMEALCKSTYQRYEDPSYGVKLNENSPFDMWFVLDKHGVLKGQYAKPPVEFYRRPSSPNEYAWRDYYKGAWALAEKGLRSTYVSRVIKSENDGFHKFTISAPVYGSDGTPIGILVAGVAAAPNLGSLVVRDTQSITVLAAPRVRDRDAPQPPSSHVILLHPDYAYGEAMPLENEQVRRLDEASRGAQRIERPLGLPPPSLVTSSDDYRDPVADPYSRYDGRWLAGFAPVGNTGMVVIVQTREAEALESEKSLAKQLATWAAISASPGAILVLFAAWHVRRRGASRSIRRT